MFHKWLVQKLFQLKKKGRKPNYSTQENLFLAERYEEYKDILDSPHKDVNTNSKRGKHGMVYVHNMQVDSFTLQGL